MNDVEDNAGFGFEDESSMWQAGYELVIELRRLRGMTIPPTSPHPEDAERAIQTFCHRLRSSSPMLSLARMQRMAHLTNANVVVAVHVLASHWVGVIAPAVNQVAVTAHGFSPVLLQKFVDALAARRGIGRFVLLVEGFLYPSEKLTHLLRPSLSVTDLIELREHLKVLPLAPEDRPDIPDNGFQELE